MLITTPSLSAVTVRAAKVTSGEVKSSRTSVLKSKRLARKAAATRCSSGSSSRQGADVAKAHSLCAHATANRGCAAMARASAPTPAPVTGALPSTVKVPCAGIPRVAYWV